jgi:hypothetical protein
VSRLQAEKAMTDGQVGKSIPAYTHTHHPNIQTHTPATTTVKFLATPTQLKNNKKIIKIIIKVPN